jgi:methylated-DNA-[protein]-cysteine S-methyltransferase
MDYGCVCETAMGKFGIRASDDVVTGIFFGGLPRQMGENALCREAARQIGEYMAGKRKVFELPVQLAGTGFQNAVWEALRAVPWGETRTYGQIAAMLGRENAARAVGGACRINPIPLIVPCHRIIGSNGSLTGFAGGLDMKRALLRLESVELARNGGSGCCGAKQVSAPN